MKRDGKEALQLQHTIAASIDNPLPWQRGEGVPSLSHESIYMSCTIVEYEHKAMHGNMHEMSTLVSHQLTHVIRLQ